MLVVSHEATRTGAPRVAVDLVDAYRDAGWHTVAVLRWGGPLRSAFERAAEVTIDEPASRLRAALSRHPRTKQLVPALSRFAARRVLRRFRPDLVWCNTVISSPYAVAAARLGIPSIVFSHEQEEVVRRSVDRSGLREVLRDSSRRPVLLGCSEDTAALFASIVGPGGGEVGTICSPIDVTAVRERAAGPPPPVDGGPLVLACGVADRRKGVDVFIEAAELATSRGIQANWCWVGRNERWESPHVRFVGEVSDAERWIAAATVFALPSRQDAFPLVTLEAMALARPIVASSLPGPAVQLGEFGRLVPAGDAAALADAVARLLGEPALAAELGAAAAQRCDELWDVSRFAAEVVRLGNELTEQG